MTQQDKIASEIALEIRKSERLFEQTTLQLCDTISGAIAGRRQAGLSFTSGHQAVSAAASALEKLTAAGSDLARAHCLAERDARRMNLNFEGLIPTEPKTPPTALARAPLQASAET